MKKLCLRYASLCCLAFLMCLTSCGKLDKVDGLESLPDAISSSRADKCALVVSGKVVNTKNLHPIADVKVGGESFTATTDENGEFSVELSLDRDDVIDDITVSKDGFLNNEFKAYLSSVAPLATCPAVTNINWEIAISERKQTVFVGPRDGAWYKIMDTVATKLNGSDSTILLTKLFTLDIRRGSLESPSAVSISPDNGRANGPGIPPDSRNLLVEEFAIEVNGSNTAGGSVVGAVDFAKALDIRWAPPVAFDPASATTVDLATLGLAAGELSLDANGNIVFLVTKGGNQAVGSLVNVEEVLLPLAEAINAGLVTLEEIEGAFVENLSAAAVASGAGLTAIATDVKSNGRIANQQSFSNCGCGDPTVADFSAQLTGTESINIDFSVGTTDTEQAEALDLLRTLVGATGGGTESVALTVALDKCQTKIVTSQEKIRTVTGTVMGFPFTYSGTCSLDTTEEEGDCPTDTPCHQGCPG